MSFPYGRKEFLGLYHCGVRTFDSYDFTHVNFSRLDLSNCLFEDCVFHSCRFSHTKLFGAEFSTCEFIACTWKQPECGFGRRQPITLLHDCDFIDCRLIAVPWSNVSVVQGIFLSCTFMKTGSEMDGSSFLLTSDCRYIHQRNDNLKLWNSRHHNNKRLN